MARVVAFTSGARRAILFWLVFSLVLPEVLPTNRHASAWPCTVAWFSQGDLKLQMNECLQSRIVTPNTSINFTVMLTNIGASMIGLVAGYSGRDPFELDLFNNTGGLIFILGHTIGYYRRALQPGSSETELFRWTMSDIIPQIGNTSVSRLGEFHLQAFLDSFVVVNSTVVLSAHQLGGPKMWYEVAPQLILPYDIFEMLIVAMLGLNIVVSIFVLREMREFKRWIIASDKKPTGAASHSGEQQIE